MRLHWPADRRVIHPFAIEIRAGARFDVGDDSVTLAGVHDMHELRDDLAIF